MINEKSSFRHTYLYIFTIINKDLMEKEEYGEKCRIKCYERKTIDLRRC